MSGLVEDSWIPKYFKFFDPIMKGLFHKFHFLLVADIQKYHYLSEC